VVYGDKFSENKEEEKRCHIVRDGKREMMGWIGITRCGLLDGMTTGCGKMADGL